MRKFCFILSMMMLCLELMAQKPVPQKPRVLISTDIGGTDPDDNQSMAHLLMYNNLFKLEGLVSSPSYGDGNKAEILRMIALYEKDLPKLRQHVKDYASPDELRAVTKQGQHGAAPFKGYSKPSEGSEWIIRCAKKNSEQPLWILVWGGLEDLAQALHDAPEILKKIKVYFIGGPNKKWCANSYAYIAENFPDLWFIESNSSYYGFFSTHKVPDSLSNQNYYKNYVRGAGHLGKDYNNNRYQGRVKMGDTPSLLYMMDGDPLHPRRENWGGSYDKFKSSPRLIFNRNTTTADTLTVYSIVEFHFKGPVISIPVDSACFTMTVQAEIGEQKWDGFYLGKGNYVIRYSPKRTETLTYKLTSAIPGFKEQSGVFVVDNIWPGNSRPTNYQLGDNWYTDKTDPLLFDGIWQGGETVRKWRTDVLLDWAKRWDWLR
jgi:hypothetical protein